MLAHFLGLDGGPFYNFFSGLFGVLIITGGLLANAYVTARKHNCHQPGCWRVGRLPVQGTAFVVCRKHHPAPPLEHTIRERYHLYAGRRIGDG